MTVIPLHPHLRRATGAERRFQPTDLARPAQAIASPIEAIVSDASRRGRAIASWLETLVGASPDQLALAQRTPGLLGGGGEHAANDPSGEGLDLPSPRDVLNALVAMADGTRKKALVPFAGLPLEMALLRRGANVLVSLYHTEAAPDVLVLDRRVPLDRALESTAQVLELLEPDTHGRLLARARELDIVEERDTGLSATRQRGGVLEDPGERETLAFGFEAAMFPSQEMPRDGVSHADVHAMLFGGQLWAWVRGRRVTLVRSGPVLLAVQRMVSAIGALVTAWEEDRALHVRLRTGSFLVGVRRDRKDASEIALTLGCEDDGAITIPALAIEDACMPVLRVAAEMLRSLVTVDRMQGRNLRIAALREEVRRLRRIVRARSKAVGFTNGDPERLLSLGVGSACESEPPRAREDREERAPGSLRFASRWNVVIDGLDATTTYFCGDRLVLSNERRVLALHRDDGQCLWQHEGAAQSAFLADQSIVRLGVDGTVEIREIATGELTHRLRLAPRVGGAPTGVFVGGGQMPPIGLVAEGRDRLAAIDLRTGELRFRYTARSPGTFRLRRAGRLVLAVNGDGNVDAIDVVSGEVVWRHSAAAKFCLTPTTFGSLAIAVSGEPGRGDATLIGLDLLSGELVHKQALGGPVATAPQVLDQHLVIALTGARRGVLASHDPRSGELRWAIPDPGMGTGGGLVSTDRAIFVNAPNGKLVALDPHTGDTLFSRMLSNPVTDDVPRRLTPLVRGGALFVPSAAVHVLRPNDGSAIGAPPPCELVPDSLHVDERGWMYVAEESGHLVALAPVQALRLVVSRS
ncbi:MAG: PQQ-binding-like beta-propeller repeat protein [Deltaproteobacteria bacterium]|nr:PQQ-binding-like beta-propeller repeat protein [Deltaproteobacteria bacterium]